MEDLEAELAAARALDVATLADAIESIGFACTRCGACCKGHGDDHTATVFPEEVRSIGERLAGDEPDDDGERDGDGVGDGVGVGDPPGAGVADGTYDWRDVARPMPFGLDDEGGETFEWALATDDCGDCVFYEDGERTEPGTCTVYGDRPLICRTYPFSIAAPGDADRLPGSREPMGDVVAREGVVRAHECEGLGREISRDDAEELARTLKARAVREAAELIAVLEAFEPAAPDPGDVVVHDSEGPKRPDGSTIDR